MEIAGVSSGSSFSAGVAQLESLPVQLLIESGEVGAG